MQGPCGWAPTHTHHGSDDLAEWNTYPVDVRSAADASASMVIWASTGRRFGLCPVVARPIAGCIHNAEPDLAGVFDGYPTQVEPGLFVGIPSGGQCCLSTDPARVRLEGPVSSVTSVTIDGSVVSSTLYRVDDESVLVRTDGGSWPLWQDINLKSGNPGTFVVSYLAGEPIPAVLLSAAGSYAIEVARAMTGSEACRLPDRVKTINRQGVSMDLVDPSSMLEAGLTGLTEVDQLIVAVNPNRSRSVARVLVPGGTARLVSA